MKKIYLFLVSTLFTTSIFAQSVISFENLELPLDTFLNNAGESGGFTSGAAFFPNVYNPDFGGYWESGWAISSSRNDSLTDFTNLYGVKPASGFQSTTYTIGQQNAIIKLTDNAVGKVVNGLYLTNLAYVYESMQTGDDFAKKFGGTDGTDPDFFKIIIRKYSNGKLQDKSVEFYLADFRADVDSLDYIVEAWQWVDLTSLGNVDSLLFTLSSSDIGDFGINTPLFFGLDNLEISNDIATSIHHLSFQKPTIKLFPNPTVHQITIESKEVALGGVAQIFDVTGRQILTQKLTADNNSINVTSLQGGVFIFSLQTDEGRISTTTFVKK